MHEDESLADLIIITVGQIVPPPVFTVKSLYDCFAVPENDDFCFDQPSLPSLPSPDPQEPFSDSPVFISPHCGVRTISVSASQVPLR